MHIYYIYCIISTFQYLTKLQQKGYKRMKRILALALALTLCLGLAATVFAALPSYREITNRIKVTSSLDENDDTWVESKPELKLNWHLNPKSVRNDIFTFEVGGRTVINDDAKLTVANLSPADCSDVLFVSVFALAKSNDRSYDSVENDVNGNPVRQFSYTASGWKTIEPNDNTSAVEIIPEHYAIPAGKEVSFTGAELCALIDSNIENPMFILMVYYAAPNGNGGYTASPLPIGLPYEVNNKLAAEIKGEKYEEPADSSNPFTDVSADAYYHDAVLWALDKNVTTGTSKTTFSPSATCTRGQVVTFLWRAMGCPEPASTENPFTDVTESDYFYKAILWAVEKGVTNGTTDTTFGPNGTCTSAHVVTFLWRANGKPAANTDGTNYYDEAVAWANSQKLLDGTAVPFAPDNLSPRADIVTYLYRVLGK